jgi:arginyl-tRNA synthetase
VLRLLKLTLSVQGQSFARELSSAGLAIVGVNFFEDLGTRVAGTILGAIAAGLCFVPFVFFRYGHRIRVRSAYSLQIKEAADQERRMRKEEELARMEAKDGT